MEENQSKNQKKIALAQSVHAPVIIELIKDCMGTNPQLIGKTQWATVVNAVRLEVQGNILNAMVKYLDEIRNGSLSGKE